MDRLLNGMGKGFETLPMAFSASTSANQTQDILDAKMDKRRKGVFGPTVLSHNLYQWMPFDTQQ
jgi:dynein heavy chain